MDDGVWIGVKTKVIEQILQFKFFIQVIVLWGKVVTNKKGGVGGKRKEKIMEIVATAVVASWLPNNKLTSCANKDMHLDK